jgi:pyruvate dehydrogenase phosphatase
MPRDSRLPGTWTTTDRGFPGDGPFHYRLLSEDDLARTLEKLARVKTYLGGRIDSISLQPCQDPAQASQDRRVAGTWDLPDGTWTYAAVFDGQCLRVGHINSSYAPS